MEVEEEEEKNSFLDHHMERLAPPRWIQRIRDCKIFAKIEWKDTSKNSQEVIKIKTPRAPRYAVQRFSTEIAVQKQEKWMKMNVRCITGGATG